MSGYFEAWAVLTAFTARYYTVLKPLQSSCQPLLTVGCHESLVSLPICIEEPDLDIIWIARKA